jgi:hypothetical protein
MYTLRRVKFCIGMDKNKNYIELVPTVMIDDLDKNCATAEPNFNK